MNLVTGATGFVGRHLVRRLRVKGLAVRAVVRTPERAGELRDLGAEVVAGDINDQASLDAAAAGCDKVVHLVGIIQEGKGFSFRSVHVDGTNRVLTAAKRAGVRQFLFQSALGTRVNARSEYHRTKWEAEVLVKASGLPFTILRPSLIYGSGDLFTLRLADMIRRSPALPVIGSGKSRIQPISIDDVTTCIAKIVTDDRFVGRTLEIGGPEELTYEEVTRAIAGALGIRRPMVHLPLLFMKTVAALGEKVLQQSPVTTDQLTMLQEDTVCGMEHVRELLGREPIEFREGLKQFLSRT